MARPTVEPITLRPLRLDQALAAAGGIRAADRATTMIRLYRRGRIYQIPLARYCRQPALQRLVRPDDVIFVSAQPITAWNRVVSQILPSLSATYTASRTGN